mmetsp:Transcript_15269/g.32310  ORF Transcript_15269/g.32310 Transcript_15269/m.32310 type:complete len:418 (-) Transcript_15269:1410-2663(-)
MSGHPPENHTTPVVVVGTPPHYYEYDDWKTVEVHFHGFEDLPYERALAIESPEFTCLGRRWRLDLYPGGTYDSDDGKVALYLTHCSNGSIEVEYGFGVKDSDRVGKLYWDDSEEVEFEKDDEFGACDFARRSRVKDALVDGTLIVEVRMKQIESTDTPVPPFVPENPLQKSILKKFMDEESADVVIEVCGRGSEASSAGTGRGGTRSKKAKLAQSASASTTTFHAHHLILQDCAPALAQICKSAKKLSPVRITDARPDIFRQMLYYVYGGTLTEEEMKANAKDIIDIADKYGVVNLKLEAEACYASSIMLTVDNMLENLLYADAKNCALLKEVVMDFVVQNGKDIIDNGTISFENVPGAMMMDLLTAVTRGKISDDDGGEDDYGTMRVSTLRRKLNEKGLDIDGSREAMIALLRENT